MAEGEESCLVLIAAPRVTPGQRFSFSSLVGLLYLIRETLFIFVVALLFAYLLWPLVKVLDRRLPGRSKVPALTLVYLALVGFLIVVGFAIGSRIVQQANSLASTNPVG